MVAEDVQPECSQGCLVTGKSKTVSGPQISHLPHGSGDDPFCVMEGLGLTGIPLKQLDLISNHMLTSRWKVVLLGLVEKRGFVLWSEDTFCMLLPDSRPCGSSQACCGLPYTSTVAVMQGKITTPRVPLTTGSWAKPAEDTGSEYAHKVTLQGRLVYLQMMGQPCPLCPAGAAELG